jgi:hypothetical protein
MIPLRVLPLTVAALAATAATAAAAPTITPANGGDDLWSARETPEYVITAGPGFSNVRWEVDVPDAADLEGRGPSPLTARLPGLPEGTFTLVAREVGRGGQPSARTFTVDRTAPAEPVIVSPTAGATFTQGQVAPAAYSCTDGARCQGPVPSGQPIDTSSVGTFTFSVTATDPAGNVTVASRTYTVTPGATVVGTPGGQASPDSPPASSGGTAAPAPAPTPVAQPVSPSQPAARLKPVLVNARLMTPRAGARIATLRPMLRWKPRTGTALYNVQVFRLDGMKLRKVVSAFPRSTRYRVPAGRLRAGQRYVWRVWPFLGKGKGFTPKPLAVSYFDVRAPRRS